MEKTNRKNLPTLIFFSLFLLVFSISSGKVFCAPKGPFSQAALTKAIKGKAHLIRSFLSITLPQRATLLLARLPAPVELHFRGIQLSQVPRVLLPKSLRNHALHGKLNLDIETKKISSGKRSVKVILKLNGLNAESLFSLKRLSLRLDLILPVPRGHLSGTCTGEIKGLWFILTPKVPAPISIRINKSLLHGTINGRRLSLKGAFKNITSPAIKMGAVSLADISVKNLNISQEALEIQDLKTASNNEAILIRLFHFNFTTSRTSARGMIRFQGRGNSPFSPLLNSIQGEVAFYARADLKNTLSPSLSVTLSSPSLNYPVDDIPLCFNRLSCNFLLKGKTFDLSPLDFTVNGKAPFHVTFHARDYSHVLDTSLWTIKSGPFEIKDNLPTLSRFYPGVYSFEKSTGRFTLQLKGALTHHLLAAAGNASFYGTLRNPSRFLSFEDVACELPLHLSIPLGNNSRKFATHPLSKSHYGILRFRKGKAGVATFNHFSARTAVSGDTLLVSDLSFTTFQGKCKGKGSFQTIPPMKWRFNLDAHDLSLHSICEGIPEFRDGLSGKVNATLTLNGDGATLKTMNGILKVKANPFAGEPLRISQKFIKKLTGRKGRFFFYQKYRPYDQGVINAAIKNGMLVFDTLEISHKILGFKDLSISVSRLGNKIALDTLFWEILQLSKQSASTPNITVK